MYKGIKNIVVLAVLLLSYCSIMAVGCSDAEVWMENINDEIFKAIEADFSADRKAEIVGKVFKPHLDVELFTKKIVGRAYWSEASVSDRSLLQNNLYDVMLKDYTQAIVQTLAKKPYVYRVKAGDGEDMSTVTVLFHTQRGKNLLANFSLQCKQSQWKIYDISVEGVRLTDMQHEKFKKILRQSGVAGLNKFLATG